MDISRRSFIFGSAAAATVWAAAPEPKWNIKKHKVVAKYVVTWEGIDKPIKWKRVA
jgi:hypothetical protein